MHNQNQLNGSLDRSEGGKLGSQKFMGQGLGRAWIHSFSSRKHMWDLLNSPVSI
jgi:hypothetical protein